MIELSSVIVHAVNGKLQIKEFLQYQHIIIHIAFVSIAVPIFLSNR